MQQENELTEAEKARTDETLGNLTSDIQELKKKSVSGFGWATAQQAAGRITTFVVQLVLAHLLTPDDFGTVAALGIFITISSSLAEAGFGGSLTRQETLDERDLSTVFYYNIGASVLFYLILFSIAPWVAGYFQRPILCPMLRIYGIPNIIYSLGTVQKVLLWRRMEFKKQMYVQLLYGVASATAGVIMAYLGFGPWALVGMSFAQAITNTVLLWYYSPWRPKRLFDKERFKVHFDFGWRVASTNILKSVYDNLATIFIGRYFSMRTLGLYGQANSFYVVPIGILADPINKVSYPVFVRVQNDLERLRAGYRKVMRLLVQLSAPIIVMLMVLASPLYHRLFGEKWMEAVSFFQILCLAGVLYPLNDYNINILLTKGRSDLYLRLDITRRVIGVVAMVIALVFRDYWGIYGLLWSQVICQVVFLFINSYYSGRFINYTIWQQLAELLPFFLMSGVSGLGVWGVDTYLTSGLPDFLRLVIGGCVMAGSYLALMFLFARQDLFYVWELLQEHLLKRKKG